MILINKTKICLLHPIILPNPYVFPLRMWTLLQTDWIARQNMLSFVFITQSSNNIHWTKFLIGLVISFLFNYSTIQSNHFKTNAPILKCTVNKLSDPKSSNKQNANIIYVIKFIKNQI